jgi:hypothetical protein
MRICTGSYNDYIFAIFCGDDLSDSGRRGFDFDGRGVHACRFQVGSKIVAEGIIAQFSDHAYVGSEAGGREGLVGAFSAGEGSKTGGGQRFPLKRDPWGYRDKIEIDASNDHEALFHFIPCPLA